MDGHARAQLCEQDVAGWGSLSHADRAAAVKEVTVCDTSEFNTVMFASPPAVAGVDGAAHSAERVVVSLPSSTTSLSSAEAVNKAAAAVFLSGAGISPRVLGTLRVDMPSTSDEVGGQAARAAVHEVQVTKWLSGKLGFCLEPNHQL